MEEKSHIKAHTLEIDDLDVDIRSRFVSKFLICSFSVIYRECKYQVIIYFRWILFGKISDVI